MSKAKKPTIFVSSSVYGREELLNQLYSILKGFGYEVWMSHKGTVPINPRESTFQSCRRATKECDLFLGIITPYYGSGKERGKQSITHQEMLLAIQHGKPRWFLAHADVVFARRLLNDLGYDSPDKRSALTLTPGAKSISDLRIIEMYEAATRHDEPELEKRFGNWVQEYKSDQDVKDFIETQFSDMERLLPFIADYQPKSEAKGKSKPRKGGAK